MTKEATKHAHNHEAEHTPENKNARPAVTVDAVLPPGSWQRVAAGVAAAAGTGLIAAAAVGVGPAALAGAAGYLAYRALNSQRADGTVTHPKSG